MKILPVTDPSFQKYGQILGGYDVRELLETLDRVTPLPEGVEYVPEQPELMALDIEKELRCNAYGGMPIQIENTINSMCEISRRCAKINDTSTKTQ